MGISHTTFYPLDLHKEGISHDVAESVHAFAKKKKMRWRVFHADIFQKEIPQTEIS